MACVSAVPFDQIDPDVQKVMQTYDKEIGDSAFLQAFAHAPEVFKSFVDYYFPLVFETRGSIDMKLTELVRLKAAERTEPEIIDLGFQITAFIGLTGSFERSG